MRVLLDSHALIWSAIDAPELSSKARSVLTAAETVGVCSMASFWEIGIKVGLGKLDLTVPLAEFFLEVRTRFEILHVEDRHCLRYVSLPFHHRDPFDRMFISQSLSDNLVMISNEGIFDAYGVQRVW